MPFNNKKWQAKATNLKKHREQWAEIFAKATFKACIWLNLEKKLGHAPLPIPQNPKILSHTFMPVVYIFIKQTQNYLFSFNCVLRNQKEEAREQKK